MHQRLPFLDGLQRLSVAQELLLLFDMQARQSQSWPRFKAHVTQAYGIAKAGSEALGPLTDEAWLVHAAQRLWNSRIRRQPEFANLTSQVFPDNEHRYYVQAIEAPPLGFIPWLETRLNAGTAYVVVPALTRCLEPLQVYCSTHPLQVNRHPDTPLSTLMRTGAGESAPEAALDLLAANISWREMADLEEEAVFVATQVQRSCGQRLGIVCPDRKLARRIRAILERSGVELLDSDGWRLSTTSASTAVALLWGAAHSPRGSLAWQTLAQCPFARPHTRPQTPDVSWEAGAWRATDSLRRLAQGHHLLYTFQEALLNALTLSGIQALLLEDAAGEVLMRALETMQRDVLRYPQPFTATEYWTWLVAQLDDARFVPPAAPARVRLLDLSEAVTHRFDQVLLAGADARHLGDADRTWLFFKDSVRGELGFPTRRESQHHQEQLFQLLLERAPRIIVTWHRRDRGQSLRVSPWFERLRMIYRRFRGNDLPQSLDLQQPAPPVTNQGTECVRARVPEEMQPRALSAAGYQRWIDCPYQYYANDVLRLRRAPETTDDRAALEYGIQIHRILEAFWKSVEGLPGPFDATLDATTRAQAEQLLEAIGQTVFATRGVRGRFEQAQWRQAIPGYVNWEIKHRADHTHIQTEVVLRQVRELPWPLVLTGRADRMEPMGDGLGIIDYKTGALPSRQDLEDGEVGALPFYGVLAGDVAQLWLLRVHRDWETRCLEGAELAAALQQTRQRIDTLVAAISGGTEFRAHGSTTICGRCAYEGLCRRSYTQTGGTGILPA